MSLLGHCQLHAQKNQLQLDKEGHLLAGVSQGVEREGWLLLRAGWQFGRAPSHLSSAEDACLEAGSLRGSKPGTHASCR